MDVDDPLRVAGDRGRRQDPHVAGHHDELDVVGGQRLEDGGLLACRPVGSVGDRQRARTARRSRRTGRRGRGGWPRRPCTSAASSPDDHRTSRSARQCAWREARIAIGTSRAVDRTSTVIPNRSAIGANAAATSSTARSKPVGDDLDALEEQPAVLDDVDVLVGVEDVAAVAGHEVGDRGDHAQLVGARQQQDHPVVGEHGPIPTARRRRTPPARARPSRATVSRARREAVELRAGDQPGLDGVLDEAPPTVRRQLVDRPAQAADAELREAVAEVVELAVELRDRPVEAAGDGPVRRQLVVVVRVAQRALGERQQQQALLVGEHDVAEGDRVAGLIVVGVERVVVVVVVRRRRRGRARAPRPRSR